MNNFGKFAAACAAVVCAFGAEARTISVGSGGDIATAIAGAQSGDVVELAATTFSPTTAIAIPDGVTVKGQGPDKTKIDGTGITTGRLFTMSSAGTKLIDLSIVGITTPDEGAAMKMSDGWVENCTFDQITASRTSASALPGGAISMTGGTVTNCTFTKCRGYGGGGVYLAGGLVTKCYFEGCRLNDNYMNMRSGAAALVDGGTLRDCEIVRNYADCGWHNSGSTIGDWCGGAVSVFNDASVVERCLIASNELSSATKTSHSQWARVAGLSLKAGLVRNCVIVGNTNTKGGEAGKYGAGVYIRGGKFYHNTVVGNWVSGDGTHRSGVLVDAGSPDIRNNIFAFNGPNGTEGGCNVQMGTFTHNLIDNPVDYAGASDNLFFDPQFLDRANGDYRLNVLSQAIDVGAEVADVTDDFVGAVRPQGLAADLGVYEHVPGSDGVQVAVMATIDSIVEGDDISFAARYEGVAEGATVVVRWYLDDPSCEGTSAAEGLTCTFTQVGSGAHTATAAIFVDGATVPAKAGSFAFSALPTTVYVDANGGNEYPYNDPDKAARSFEDAINALAAKTGVTSTIYVAAGDYTATASHSYGVPFRLIGEGADVVTIAGSGTRTGPLLTCTDSCEMRGVTFTGVSSTGAGGNGGVLNMKTGVIAGCAFSNNTTGNNSGAAVGGAIYMGGNGLITNCVFTGNSGRAGNGVYMKDGLVVDCTFTGNKLYNWYSSVGGAAVALEGGTVRRCEIVGNRPNAGYYTGTGGAAVSLFGDNALVEDCNISGNLYENDKTVSYSQYGRAAGVCMTKGTVRNCIIAANTNSHGSCAYSAGGGVYVSGGKFYHNTVVGNTYVSDAKHRSGIEVETGSPDVRNNIFAYNRSGSVAGGVRVQAGTFADNVVDNDIDYAGATNWKNLDPAFVDYANGDYRLSATSPAIDLGVEAGGIAVDHRGVERPQGEKYDAGAYEYVPGEFGAVVAVLADADTFIEGDDVVVSTRIEGAPAGATVVVRWYLDDPEMSGNPVAEGTSYTYEQSVSGQHTLTAAVFVNGETTPTATGSFAFQALPTTVYVNENGGDEFPYTSAATAAKSFDAAMAALATKAGVTSTVYVAAGNYTFSAFKSYSVPFKLIGDGADRVTINVSGSFITPIFTCSDWCELRGVTIRGTRTTGTGVVKMMDGLVEGCVFDDNRGGNGTDCEGGAAINMLDGLVTNCVFTGNSGYGGSGVTIYGGLVTGCRFTGNQLVNSYGNMRGGAAVLAMGGTVRNCEIVGNIANSGPYSTSWSGGGAVSVMNADAVVENCLIASNKLDNSQSYAKWGYVAGVNLTAGTVRNCIIIGNENSNTAGDGNSVKGSAGAYVQGGRFYHNTVVGNYAQGDTTCRSGIMLTGNGDVSNNIFAFNGKTGTEGGCNVAAGTFVNNIIDNDLTYAGASGNLKLDPQFVDLAGGDLRVKATSKAIDLGEDVGVAVDYRGVERPQGLKFDAGAYEYLPGEFGLVYGVSAETKTLKSGDGITLTMTIDGLSPSDEVVCKWFCDDETMQGEPVGEGMTYDWTAPAAGTRKATAAFFVNGSDEPTGSDTFTFDVLPFEVFVAADGGHVKPYDTPETAARTFDDAWASVWKDETVTAVVHVAAGAYTNKTGYVLNTPVRIIGAGVDVVTFTSSADMNALNVPLFKVMTNDVELSGFMVSDCASSASGKAVWLNGGVVRDCRFERNTGGGNGGAVHQEGGLVTNCVFNGNVAVTGGGLWMSAGEAVDCAFAGNVCRNSLNSLSGAAVYLSGGTLRRARVVGNQVSAGQYEGFSGGAVMVAGADALVENCVIEKNFTKEIAEGSGNAYFRSAGACMSAGVIRNCLISANTNSIAWRNDNYMTFLNGAGLVVTGGRAYNNTIIGNVLGTGSIVNGGRTAPADDDKLRAGLYLVSGLPVVKNNIVAFSERLVQGGESQMGGVFVANGTFAKNVTDNDTGISDNWFVPVPPFKNARSGNYRLKGADDIFVNTGDSSVWTGVVDPVDLDGKARIRDKVVDLGCYEKLVNGMAIIVR